MTVLSAPPQQNRSCSSKQGLVKTNPTIPSCLRHVHTHTHTHTHIWINIITGIFTELKLKLKLSMQSLVMLQFVCIMLDTRYIHRAAAAVCFTEICSWKASCVLKMHKICKSANPFYVKCISINKENITLPKYIFRFSLVFISLLMAFLP